MKNDHFVILKTFQLGMILLFMLTGCRSQNPSEGALINSTSITAMGTLTPTLLTDPTLVKSQEPAMIPTSSFSNGVVAKVSQQEVTDDIFQDIVKIMVTKWLQGFQIDSSSQDAIKDYRIEEIYLRNQPDELHSEIIATVLFSVQVMNPQSSNWASVSVQEIKKDDPWWHVALTFDILPVKDNYELKVLFGYGT